MDDNSPRAIDAAILQCGYNVGYFNEADIERWAEAQIADLDEPSEALIELAILRNMHPLDVMKLLRSVGKDVPATQWIAAQIGFIGTSFAEGKLSLVNATRALYALVLESGISSDEESAIYYLDDGYDLAVAGTHGSLAEVEAELRRFVMPYAERLQEKHSSLFRKGK
jgi:hypothetical protein